MKIVKSLALFAAMYTAGCIPTEGDRWYARYSDNTPARLVARERTASGATLHYFDLDGNPSTAEVAFQTTGRCNDCAAKMASIPMGNYVTVGTLYALSQEMANCPSFSKYGVNDGMHIGLNTTQQPFSKNVGHLQGGR